MILDTQKNHYRMIPPILPEQIQPHDLFNTKVNRKAALLLKFGLSGCVLTMWCAAGGQKLFRIICVSL